MNEDWLLDGYEREFFLKTMVFKRRSGDCWGVESRRERVFAFFLSDGNGLFRDNGFPGQETFPMSRPCPVPEASGGGFAVKYIYGTVGQ